MRLRCQLGFHYYLSWTNGAHIWEKCVHCGRMRNRRPWGQDG